MPQANESVFRVVVLGHRPEPSFVAVAEQLASAFGDLASTESSIQNVPAPQSYVPGLMTMPPPANLNEPDALHEADAVVALDARAMDRARSAGVPFRVALLPSFDLGWAGDLADADLVLVAHAGLVDEVVRRGATADAVEVVGPIGPPGFVPAVDVSALRRELGLPSGKSIVLVPSDSLVEHDLTQIVVQLTLVSSPAVFLFDVGQDLETAEMLRRLVPGYGLDAFMFADCAGAEKFWQAADVVFARARGPEAIRGLAVGAPLLLMSPGRSDAHAVSALRQSGAASVIEAASMVAPVLDQALGPAALSLAKSAARLLDAASAPERTAVRVHKAWKRARGGSSLIPRGLPIGLERLVRSSDAPTGT